MIQAHTTRDVQYHGWTLPAGSHVTLERICLGGWKPTATARCALSDYDIAIPTDSLPYSVWDLLPVRSD